MRTFSVITSAALFALAFGIEPTKSLDGSPSPNPVIEPGVQPRDCLFTRFAAIPQIKYEAWIAHGIAPETGRRDRVIPQIKLDAPPQMHAVLRIGCS